MNPLPHIDPIGTVLIPLITMLGGFMIGWAKPVPVDVGRLKYPRKDHFWVAFAGPLANLAMAIGWGLIGAIAIALHGVGASIISSPLAAMSDAGIKINLVLMAFNLLPIPPLDGSRMLARFLKGHARMKYEGFEQWGFFVVIALALTGIINLWISPFLSAFSWISKIPGLAFSFA